MLDSAKFVIDCLPATWKGTAMTAVVAAVMLVFAFFGARALRAGRSELDDAEAYCLWILHLAGGVPKKYAPPPTIPINPARWPAFLVSSFGTSLSPTVTEQSRPVACASLRRRHVSGRLLLLIERVLLVGVCLSVLAIGVAMIDAARAVEGLIVCISAVASLGLVAIVRI